MEAGEEGKEGAAELCDFSQGRAAGQSRNPGLLNPHPPAHPPRAPTREITLTAHLIKHTLPLPLKMIRKRSVKSHSK